MKNFCYKNNYPKWGLIQIMNSTQNKEKLKKLINKNLNLTSTENNSRYWNKRNGEKPYQLVLSYHVAQVSQQQRKSAYLHRGTKLRSRFIINVITKFEHQHNLIYFGNCTKNICTDNYIGDTARKIMEKIELWTEWINIQWINVMDKYSINIVDYKRL